MKQTKTPLHAPLKLRSLHNLEINSGFHNRILQYFVNIMDVPMIAKHVHNPRTFFPTDLIMTFVLGYILISIIRYPYYLIHAYSPHVVHKLPSFAEYRDFDFKKFF